MDKTPAPEPTTHTLNVAPDGDGYSIHVTGSKPIRLGTDEAARLARVLLGDRTTPYHDPAPEFHDEPEVEPSDDEPDPDAD